HLSPGGHVFVAVITSGGSEVNVDSLTLSVSANLRPQVVLNAAPTEGEVPFTVTLNAMDSFDQDGMIIDYEWDLDGDGLTNEEGSEADAQGTTTVELEIISAGNHTPAVYIRDNQGALSAGGAFISAYGWGGTTVRPDGTFAAHSDLAHIIGCPAISYYNGAQSCLHYAWPKGANLLGDWDSEAVDPAPGAGTGTAMLVFAGDPAIAYIRRNAASPEESLLCFAYSNGGSNQKPGDWTITEIEAVGDVAAAVDLLNLDGKPAIACFNAAEGSLRFISSATQSGSDAADWQGHKVADASGTECWCSMALVNGRPAIAYYEGNSERLSYAISSAALPAEGSDWSSV